MPDGSMLAVPQHKPDGTFANASSKVARPIKAAVEESTEREGEREREMQVWTTICGARFEEVRRASGQGSMKQIAISDGIGRTLIGNSVRVFFSLPESWQRRSSGCTV